MGRPSKIKEGDFLELKNGFVEVLKYVDYKNILVKPKKEKQRTNEN